MFEKFLKMIEESGTVVIHRHTNPDGDALGSQIGLYELIRTNYPEKKVYKVGDMTPRYAFMDGSVMDEIPDGTYENALTIVLDSATAELVSDGRFRLAAKTARLDHHIYCEKYTDLEIVDTSFESCAGMVAEFAWEQHLQVSDAAATAMFTGMVTDSGRFRYDATSARTFALASFLMERKIDTNTLYRNLYQEDLARVQLRAHFLEKIRMFEDSPVAYMYNTKEELAEMNIGEPFSVSRGMVNVMADIRGIDIWVNFTEDGDKVLCELRSSCYNINPIAVKYGGGGHQKASGATLPDRETAMRMLEDLKKLTE